MAKEEKNTKAGAEGEAKAGGKGGSKGSSKGESKKAGGAKKGKGAPKADAKGGSNGTIPVPRKRNEYVERAVPQMIERFSYTNAMQAPRLEKIVVNMGVGDAVSNSKLIDNALADLQTITGQRPSVRRARLSISNFKLRQGNPVGVAVTLRRVQMWEFLDRLITFAVPRIRDFRGIPRRGFDGRGNFSIGVKEQLIFPEIEYDKVDQIRGMNITFVTSAKSDEEAFELLSALGMPFTRDE